jgi:hypothetical protein
LKSMSKFPGVSSCHTTYMLPPLEIICGTDESPSLLLRFLVLASIK